MRRNLYAALGAQWASAVMGIVASVLVARMMQPRELGIFTVTMAMTAILGTLQMAGASDFLLYSKQLDVQTRRSVYGMTTVLTFVVCAFLVLGGPVFVAIYHEPGIAHVARIVAIQMALWNFIAPVYSMLSRAQRFDLISIGTLSQNVVLSTLQVLFVWLGLSYMGLAYAALCAGIVSTLVYGWIGRAHLLALPSFRGLRPIVGTTSKLFAANALNLVNSNAPPLLIGGLSGVAHAALFGRANMISQIYSQTIARAVDPLINARIAEDTRNGIGPTGVLVDSSRILLTLTTAFFGFIALTAHLIVPLIFGPQWVAAASPMRALAIGLIVWPLTSPTSAIILAAGRSGLLIRVRAINAVVRAAVVVLLSPWGLTAIAYGIAATSYLNLFQALAAARHVANVNVRDLFVRLGPSLMTGLLPLAVTATAMVAMRAAGQEGWALLILTGMVMAVATLLSIVLFRHPLWLEAQHIVGRLRTRQA